MITKVISGGQTGADRAALDAAIEVSVPIGGSCPAGKKAEDGEIPDSYGLQEISGGYRQRTRKNVADSDGTVIFYDAYLSGGTELTLQFCIRLNKPYKLIDSSLIDAEKAAALLIEFSDKFQIKTLNVAGPRASNHPGMYGFVKQAICRALTASAKHE
ncbi:putative molybdenum carrier protein [Marinobacter sp. SS5-14b]|uniref:putative molybdenum carrier protein n=1 Tax=Marinobacter sp. SS5-14b TaxID=3050456 RepID=UPI0026DFDBB7|nr:putative molybdenum carrier protein [Marinobacter sp. SS5-14b]